MRLTTLPAAILALACAHTAQAGTLVFSVENPSPADWVLVDLAGTCRPRTAPGSPPPATVPEGGWILPGGARLVFEAESGDPRTQIQVGLRATGAGAALPSPEAALKLPLPYPTLADALDVSGNPHPVHRFQILADGTLATTVPAPGEEGKAPTLPQDPGRSVPPGLRDDRAEGSGSPVRRLALSPEKKAEGSPNVRLKLDETPRSPEPLADIPTDLQRPTVGRPRMVLTNRSAQAWFLIPWKENGRCLFLEGTGRWTRLKRDEAVRILPGKTALLAMAGSQGLFGLQDHRGMSRAVVVLTAAETRIAAPPPAGKSRPGGPRPWSPPPPGLFQKDIRDSQSWTILRDDYSAALPVLHGSFGDTLPEPSAPAKAPTAGEHKESMPTTAEEFIHLANLRKVQAWRAEKEPGLMGRMVIIHNLSGAPLPWAIAKGPVPAGSGAPDSEDCRPMAPRKFFSISVQPGIERLILQDAAFRPRVQVSLDAGTLAFQTLDPDGPGVRIIRAPGLPHAFLVLPLAP